VLNEKWAKRGLRCHCPPFYQQPALTNIPALIEGGNQRPEHLYFMRINLVVKLFSRLFIHFQPVPPPLPLCEFSFTACRFTAYRFSPPALLAGNLQLTGLQLALFACSLACSKLVIAW
jgi:hypothetical protein